MNVLREISALLFKIVFYLQIVLTEPLGLIFIYQIHNFKKSWLIFIIFTSIILEHRKSLKIFCQERFPSARSNKRIGESSTNPNDDLDIEDYENKEEEDTEVEDPNERLGKHT